jgi:hypothetical protein
MWAHALLSLPRTLARDFVWTITDDIAKLWNASLAGKTTPPLSGNLSEEIRVIICQSERRTDISDHLLTLYAEAVEMRPKVIVELGTRGGESTRVLLKAAERCSGTLVSVDIVDCSDTVSSNRWVFVKSDDVEFGQNWPEWSRRHGLPETVNFLFIDTSHQYEHTLKEIGTWFPRLAPHAKAAFHDTNMRTLYRRRDGSIGPGWNNQRGVIRAIESYLGVGIDERQDFCGVIDGWFIKHDPICNGLTILRRLE